MKGRKFIIYSLVYLIIVCLSILFFFKDVITSTRVIELHLVVADYSFEFRTIYYLAALLGVYMVFAILYFYTSFFSHQLAMRKLKKDALKFDRFLEELVLEKKQTYFFKTNEFLLVSDLVKQLYSKQASMKNNRLSNALALKAMIENKEVCDVRLFRLDKDNVLYIQNEINKVSSDMSYALNHLKHKTELSDEIDIAAYKFVLENAEYNDIKNLKIVKTKQDVLSLLNRFINKDLVLSNAELEVLIFSVDFSEEEYLYFAKELSKVIDNVSLQSLFFKIKSEKQAALRAYLYMLAKLGMMEELMEYMHNHEDEYQDFLLVIFLKEQGKSYDVDKLIC